MNTWAGGPDESGLESAVAPTGRLQIFEPRCRICREPRTRKVVNDLLDLRWLPLLDLKTTRIPLTRILNALEPINAGRSGKDQITYASLWNHTKRHYEYNGVIAYWMRKIDRQWRDAVAEFGHRTSGD